MDHEAGLEEDSWARRSELGDEAEEVPREIENCGGHRRRRETKPVKVETIAGHGDMRSWRQVWRQGGLHC